MIYDCLMNCGEVVGNKNLFDRLENCEKVMKKSMILSTDPLILRVKKFFLHDDFAQFMDDYLPKIKQEVDGLIFTPVNTPIKIGTHETMFKWKPRNKNTIDFLVKREKTVETPGCVPGAFVYKLYIQDKGCLLYTSPSPRDGLLSRMPSSA